MQSGSTDDKTSRVHLVVLDDIFSDPDRPINKRTGKPVEPKDVAFVKASGVLGCGVRVACV